MMTSAERPSVPGSGEDLAALPPPRRPFRRATFAVMAITAAFASWLVFGLRGELAYALRSQDPHSVGNLSQLMLSAELRNEWVRGEGSLSTRDVVRYSRPLEADHYRLARVENHPRLWVELRVPSDADGERFVAPGAFFGRLLPADEAGLRYGALPGAVLEAGKPALAPGSWLLIEGESPANTRWVLGLALLLLGFAAFNLLGIVRLARRVRDD